MAVDSSKTEKASPKKRQDERKRGNVFQSRDVVSAVSLIALFMVLRMVIPLIYKVLLTTVRRFMEYASTVDALSVNFVMQLLGDVLIILLITVGPPLLTAVAISILGTGVQTRFLFSKENLKFKFSKLNPIQGLGKLLSMRSLIELLKNMLKIAVIVYVLIDSYLDIYDEVLNLIFRDLTEAAVFMLSTVMDTVLSLSMVFIALGAADYLYQWWEYERNMRMSKQELREEYKQLEGDPQIKGKIRERQRSMAMGRMMQQVPTADVIIRNPTHFAVALRYDYTADRAPVVVAKGQDYLALRIIEIAEQNDILMTENKPLAQALYHNVELNREIPPEFYAVLAEVLAWVYSMKKEKTGV